MVFRIATVLVFFAAVIAVNAECEADNTDSVNLLQTSVPKSFEFHSGSVDEEISLFGFTLSAGYDTTAAFAEFLAMTLFVIIGCGSAMAVANEPGWVLQVAMSFGLGITALAYSIGHFSGGHINPAVTFGLVIAGKCSVLQGCLNVIAQLLGSILGAAILTAIFPEDKDKTGGLGANAVGDGFGKFNAFVAEFVGTFLLMFVIFQTAVNPQSKANREMAALAIGFAVFLAHCVLINIDGCSINPARSFGPALVRKLCYTKKSGDFGDMWIFFAGPLLGAAGAAFVSTKLLA